MYERESLFFLFLSFSFLSLADSLSTNRSVLWSLGFLLFCVSGDESQVWVSGTLGLQHSVWQEKRFLCLPWSGGQTQRYQGGTNNWLSCYFWSSDSDQLGHVLFFFSVSHHFFFTKPTWARGKKNKIPKEKKNALAQCPRPPERQMTHRTTVNPEYFVCMLFSYISYTAPSVRK